VDVTCLPAFDLQVIEKAKQEEIDSLTASIKKLETSLASVQSSKSTIDSSIIRVKQGLGALTRVHRELAANTQRELNEVKQNIKTTLSGALVQKLRGYDDKMKEVEAKYRKEMQERKKLHNIIQELKGNIRVYMRYVSLQKFHDIAI
jgi:chromosome segregation ATPase